MRFLATATLFCQALSASGTDALENAKTLYFRAVEGDKEALNRSAKVLEEVSEERPGDALVMAYLGSARLLEAGRTLALWKKGKLAQQGLELADRAVSASPQHLEVRFLRAASTFHLPGLFRRQQQSEEDFAWLAERAAQAAERGELDRRLAAAAMYYHGLFRERRSDHAGAREAWAAAARISPQSRAGRDAASKLAKATAMAGER